MRVVWLTWALVGCGGEDLEVVCWHDPPLDHANFGEKFLEKHCNGCHSSLVPASHRFGAPSGVDFDTYAGVMTHAERIRDRVSADENPMPPSGGPEPVEVENLIEWIDCAVLPDRARWEEGT